MYKKDMRKYEGYLEDVQLMFIKGENRNIRINILKNND